MKMEMKILKLITVRSSGGILASLFLLVFGCAMLGEVQEGPPPIERKEKIRGEKRRHEGSLWDQRGQGRFLFADHKARMVGDLITIMIVDTSSASNEASTATGKKSNVSFGIDGFLGSPTDFGLQNVWGRGNSFSPKITAKSENSHDGKGATSRKGTFSATLTARVMEVIPNGNLRIRARRDVTVNEEQQLLVLSGIVRPKDISRENVVLSSNIADAKISFTGTGVVSDKQRPGWLVRILDWVWPF